MAADQDRTYPPCGTDHARHPGHPGAAIRRSDVALLSRIKYSAAVVADVLAAAGMLEEDRQPAVVRWFDAAVADLPAPMRRELGVWFDVMRNGSRAAPQTAAAHPDCRGTLLPEPARTRCASGCAGTPVPPTS
jgi:hypothetical protein